MPLTSSLDSKHFSYEFYFTLELYVLKLPLKTPGDNFRKNMLSTCLDF